MKHFFVAGFDFGTSYSKVVLREQLTGIAKAVTFGSSASGLFPSFVRVGDGVVYGPEVGGGELVLSYPKLIATDAASGASSFSSLYGGSLSRVHQLLKTDSLDMVASLILARYFLSVLDAIHQFLADDEDWRSFRAGTDPLVVQIAVPIGLNASDDACNRIMQRALAAATLLRSNSKNSTTGTNVVDLQGAFEQLNQLDGQCRQNLDDRCITYPEVAAGVHTILRSPNTPDGKYITMDVGAGTVDLNAFLRRRRESHEVAACLDYWACEVRPLGFSRLHLPSSTHHRQAHEQAVNPLHETDLLNQLRDAITALMNGAFRYQPNRVAGNGPRPWAHATFAYIWGGGTGHSAYETALQDRLKDAGIGISSVNRLPRPSDHFVLPHDADFGRLAIAYGLSFHKINLETVRLPRELKVFDELYPAYWHEMIDSEKICSCRGNPACARCHGSGLIRPDESIAPNLAFNVSPHAVPSVRPKPRVEIALDNCIRTYNEFSLAQAPPFLVERFLLIDRIRQLRRRPEISNTSPVLQQADGILLYNVRLFRGRVRVLRQSAKRVSNGWQCVVQRRGRHTYTDVVVTGPTRQIEMVVNRAGREPAIDLICEIGRTERGEFFLEFKDVAGESKKTDLRTPPNRAWGRAALSLRRKGAQWRGRPPA